MYQPRWCILITCSLRHLSQLNGSCFNTHHLDGGHLDPTHWSGKWWLPMHEVTTRGTLPHPPMAQQHSERDGAAENYTTNLMCVVAKNNCFQILEIIFNQSQKSEVLFNPADISSKTRAVVHGAALTKKPNAFTFYTHNSSLSASQDPQPPSTLTQSEYSLISPHILSTLLATQNILAHLLRGNFCFGGDRPSCQFTRYHFFGGLV